MLYEKNHLHILLVEDTNIIRISMEELLKLQGCRVSVATSGEDAIKKFHAGIDGVLMDIGLPGIDGYQATRAIRQQYPNHQVCIYACSAFGQDIEEKCKKSGMNSLIQKPCLFANLQEFLSEVRQKSCVK